MGASALAALAILTPAGAAGVGAAKLEEARSVVAEAAALERARTAGALSPAAAEAVRRDLRRELTSLAREPGLAPSVHAALRAIDRRDQAALSTISQRLARMQRADRGRLASTGVPPL